ncbi:MAG: hypothetical protein HY367_01365 [Candidatus Aenigmarchaeota archaeon]|nr:hypothetical protein [Candidatus Aenigmarchaeota archaeon]
MPLRYLFNPKSVLLVGSSSLKLRESMVSPEVFKNIYRNLGHFCGKAYIYDVEGRERILPEVDLAVIVLPPDKTIGVMNHLKAKSCIIIPGGFNEKHRIQLKGMAKKRGIRILGPNSIGGVINPGNGLNTTFEPGVCLKPGGAAILSQSGGIGATILDIAISGQIGVSKFAWVGNMLDINETHLLEYLSSDVETKTIAAYFETLKNPRKFLEVAGRTRKPVILLKGGISKASQERALTHTDSLSTQAGIYSGAFRQAGIIEAESLGDLVNYVILFEHYRHIRGNRLAVISNTGGSAVLAADWCHKLGLELPEFSGRTRSGLKKRFPGIEPINPLDIIADADGRKYREVLETVLKDSNIDGVLLVSQFRSCLLKPDQLEVLEGVKSQKPIIACAPGSGDFRKAKFYLGDALPVYSSVKNAVGAFSKLAEYSAR